VAVYAIGLGIATDDKLLRVGAPDVGWLTDDYRWVSPSRLDASDLGLRGGGRALAVNGTELSAENAESEIGALLNWEVGAANTLRFDRRGQDFEIEIPVRLWTWDDALFAHGAIDILALLFVAAAIVSFVLRPYEPTSWAVLALSCVTGGLLTLAFVPSTPDSALADLYLRTLVGFMPVVVLQAGLAFPVIHPLLVRGRGGLATLYALGAAHAALQVGGWRADFGGPFAALPVLGSGLLVGATLFFIARSCVLAFRTRDPLVAQRARILLAGALFGAAPVSLAIFVRNTLGTAPFDMRFVYWGLGLFFLPLGYISVRQNLVNARAAVRQALAYGAVAGVLTAVGLLLVAVQAYAIALLLFPLLYWWPSFDQRLTARLYPKRAHFSELLQQSGAELGAQDSVDALLETLARLPDRLCDARSAVAFLLPGVAGDEERVHTTDGHSVENGALSDEILIKLMTTTRREVFRDQIAVEPLYANIEADCYAGLDRLDAELLLPIQRDGEVLGGLAVGARQADEVYEPPEVFALATVADQFAQSLERVEALESLRARESEFAELKRFFPPQIIDQVMQRGGAAELRSRRKLVSVFFADLRGFTTFSETAEPEEVMATLAEFHDAMGRRVAEFQGTLERFTGDGFMVFFNDPLEQPDHVARAVQMALAMRKDASELRSQWKRLGYEIDVGMGIHTGYATVGFIGYEGRRDYAVVGTVTNLAARLSDAAAGGEILVTDRVRSELADVEAEPAGELELKGFQRRQLAYRLAAGQGG
jgi:class 3 adenylate cyclase